MNFERLEKLFVEKHDFHPESTNDSLTGGQSKKKKHENEQVRNLSDMYFMF